VVDRILLAIIDPTRFRFGVYNHSGGYRTVDQWMHKLGAALVVNGSYFAPGWKPATPLLSSGKVLGPKEYHGKGGIFSAAKGVARVQSLANQSWQTSFANMTAGLVSYPILIDGSYYDQNKSRWLANRSWIGQDKDGWIIIGTTVDAFFSLDRLAAFLHESPLDLTIALNLDGGPVACQAIQLNGFERKTYGNWEMRTDDDDALLLMTLKGIPSSMPVVIAVFPN
jgi:exopolysaccharide biosynthesis protein